MTDGALGKIYANGEIIVRQGEAGDSMFVVQGGQVEVVQEREGRMVRLAALGPGDLFGEMALFEREVRSATVRALGEARVLTIDKKAFLRRVHADPTLAYRLLETLSQRVRRLDAELTRLKAEHPQAQGPAAGNA